MTRKREIDPALPLSQVLAATGVSRTTLWRMVRAATFPQPIYLTGRKIGWRQSAVQDWLDARPTVEYPQRPAA